MLEAERPRGAAIPPAEVEPLPAPRGPEAARVEGTGFWHSPWVRPLQFGLPADEGDAIWSVTGAGRAPLGLPPEAAPERLTFGDDGPPVRPGEPPKPVEPPKSSK
jgi:hypothetical protein